MCNSQSSRIGSCKWNSCSCESGEVGENKNGQFYCAHCGHLLNDHYPRYNNAQNNSSNNYQSHIMSNNGNLSPLIRGTFQQNNVLDYGLCNRHQLNNSAPSSNIYNVNMNYNNSLQHIRSPVLQNAFDYIRLTNHNTALPFTNQQFNTNSSTSNINMSRLSSVVQFL